MSGTIDSLAAADLINKTFIQSRREPGRYVVTLDHGNLRSYNLATEVINLTVGSIILDMFCNDRIWSEDEIAQYDDPYGDSRHAVAECVYQILTELGIPCAAPYLRMN